MKQATKIVKKNKNSSNALTKQDIHQLSKKIDRNQKALDQIDGVSKKLTEVSAKIDRNQKALDQIDGVSKKLTEVSAKIDRNQKALDQIDGVSKKMDNVVKILQDNEENLKNLGGLQHRLDTLDKIMITVDKIAGNMQTYQQEQVLNSNKLSDHEERIEKVETHLHITPAA